MSGWREWVRKPPLLRPLEERMAVENLRPCACGVQNWRCGSFVDLVNCQGCGAIHLVGPVVNNPVARLTIKE